MHIRPHGVNMHVLRCYLNNGNLSKAYVYIRNASANSQQVCGTSEKSDDISNVCGNSDFQQVVIMIFKIIYDNFYDSFTGGIFTRHSNKLFVMFLFSHFCIYKAKLNYLFYHFTMLCKTIYCVLFTYNGYA